MEEYILKQIKENKIKNNVHCPVIIFEKDRFRYEGKEYINIYAYCKNRIITMDINGKKPICVRPAIFITSETDDKFCCLCYLYDDIKDNMVITKYITTTGTYEIQNIDLVDYNSIDFDENNLNILKELNLKGFKELIVLPKIKDCYWICSCGQFNTEKECTNCNTKKGFIEYYANEKDIHQKFAEKEFDKQVFNSENMEEEIENFKKELLSNDKFKIKKEYLNKEFFDKLLTDTNNKVMEFKNRDNRNKYIKRNLILVASFIALLIFISIAALIINYSNKNKDIINKYCDSTNYTKVSSIEKAIKSKDCGTMVNYLAKKRLSNKDKETLIKSDNKKYYKIYYELKKENIHESMLGDYFNLSYIYMQYLNENNYEIPEESINDVLNRLVSIKDKENFAIVAGLLKGRDIRWKDDFRYFDYGYPNYIKPGEEVKLDYKSQQENTKNYTELSKIFHEKSGNYNCFVADLHSVENMKYLFENKNNKACEYAFSNVIAEYDINYIKMYHNAGGSFEYSSYLGGFFHHLAKDSKYEELSSAEFEEKVKYLKEYNADINLKMEKDDAYPEYTPLDTFFETYASTCRSASGNRPTAYETKNCNTYKSYYKSMKKYGAVCNKNCDDEKYFK